MDYYDSENLFPTKQIKKNNNKKKYIVVAIIICIIYWSCSLISIFSSIVINTPFNNSNVISTTNIPKDNNIKIINEICNDKLICNEAKCLLNCESCKK